MAFFNKLKWILGILMIFVLIVATNLIDRSNFLVVRDSVESIYEDRFVAKDILFDISAFIHEKELAIVQSDSIFFLGKNEQINKDIEDLAFRFEQTKLTNDEAKTFDAFMSKLENLEKSELNFIQSKFKEKSSLINQISDIKESLHKLSKIQLSEGSKQMSISKRAINAVELFTSIEIYILVFLAIVIQIIVMYNPKKED